MEVNAGTTAPDTTPTPVLVPGNQSKYSLGISFVQNLFKDRNPAGLPAMPLEPSITTSFTSLGKSMSGKAEINDRLNVFQEGIKYMSTQGPAKAEELNNSAINLLHNKQRPQPTIFLDSATSSPSQRYPYARRVDVPNRFQNFPDPGRVFDDLLKAQDKRNHPGGISSLTFAFANIISLSLFRTNREKPAYNETSPYLDLAPLYGTNEDEEARVRVKDGRGMLSPDCFFEDRLTFLPPSVATLLILWNRNHNYIARQLLLINENIRWVDPSTHPLPNDGSTNAHLATQDNEIFETARLINCGHFRNIVIEDFLKGLLGLASVGNSANLNILSNIELEMPKGQGHHASVESSLLFHWSALTSEIDVQWTEGVMKEEFSGISFDKITPDGFERIMDNIKAESDPNRRRRNYAGLQRGEDGLFKDDDLARILQDATESVASAPRARGTPGCLRVMEMMVIAQARKWNVCSLNEFRKYLGLRPFKEFQEWNPDPEIIAAATNLYKDIDNLELYPGLQAEATMPVPGFCMGYTMTYGLLVEFVTLVRSDPRFTTEFTANKLTKWGYNDCIPAPNDDGAFGANMPKLLLRNLPRSYPYDNIYSLFPFTLPTIARSSGKLSELHDLRRPGQIKTLSTEAAINHVFNSPGIYPTTYGRYLKNLTGGYGFFLGFDDEKHHDLDRMMALYALIPDTGALSRYALFYRNSAERLIKEKSQRVKPASRVNSIDIVRDVINVTCTRWVCETICGVPSKWENNDAEMFKAFVALHSYIFRHNNPEQGWNILTTAVENSRVLTEHIEKQLRAAYGFPDETFKEYFWRVVNELIMALKPPERKTALGKQPMHPFLTRLLNSSKNVGRLWTEPDSESSEPKSELNDLEFSRLKALVPPGPGWSDRLQLLRIVANVLGLSIMASVSYAQACAQAVNFYLDERNSKEREAIIKLSKSNDANDNTKIMGYIREAQRLDQPLGLFRGVQQNGIIEQGSGLPDITVQKGDRIFADFKAAHMNAADFHEPQRIDWERNTPSIQGMGFHKCSGLSFVDETMTEIFKAIFRLEGVRRAPGREGELTAINLRPQAQDTDPKAYVTAAGEITVVPESLVLWYDSDEELSKTTSVPSAYAFEWKLLIACVLIVLVATFLLWLLFFITTSLWNHPPSVTTVMIVLTGISVWWLRTRHPASFWKRVPSLSTASVGLGAVFMLWLLFNIGTLLRASKPSPPSEKAEAQLPDISCQPPTTVFQLHESNTMLPGPDGQPLPIEYTLTHHRPHRLTVIDIDVRDMLLEVKVDGTLRGRTTELELDKSVQCGDIPVRCRHMGFSTGVVVILPGKPTVQINWAGKKFLLNTDNIEEETPMSTASTPTSPPTLPAPPFEEETPTAATSTSTQPSPFLTGPFYEDELPMSPITTLTPPPLLLTGTSFEEETPNVATSTSTSPPTILTTPFEETPTSIADTPTPPPPFLMDPSFGDETPMSTISTSTSPPSLLTTSLSFEEETSTSTTNTFTPPPPSITVTITEYPPGQTIGDHNMYSQGVTVAVAVAVTVTKRM